MDPLIELKELNFHQNKITSLQNLKNVPNLDKLNLSDNPISVIFPDAFTQLNNLGTL